MPVENLTWTVQADISAQFTVVALPNTTHLQQGRMKQQQLILACIFRVSIAFMLRGAGAGECPLVIASRVVPFEDLRVIIQ